MILRVEFSKTVQKQLRFIPKHVVIKLLAWADDIEIRGLEEVRKIPGYHDEPLKGRRSEQRSIRLSRAYRAIYLILESGSIEFVSVEEIDKHDY